MGRRCDAEKNGEGVEREGGEGGGEGGMMPRRMAQRRVCPHLQHEEGLRQDVADLRRSTGRVVCQLLGQSGSGWGILWPAGAVVYCTGTGPPPPTEQQRTSPVCVQGRRGDTGEPAAALFHADSRHGNTANFL